MGSRLPIQVAEKRGAIRFLVLGIESGMTGGSDAGFTSFSKRFNEPMSTWEWTGIPCATASKWASIALGSQSEKVVVGRLDERSIAKKYEKENGRAFYAVID